MITEAIKYCTRCGGPLINGWSISQYNLPVCDSCKIAICGEMVRHKPSATSNTLQDPTKPHLPFDLVREWRQRADEHMELCKNSEGATATFYRALRYTYLRCADELENHRTWREAVKQ